MSLYTKVKGFFGGFLANLQRGKENACKIVVDKLPELVIKYGSSLDKFWSTSANKIHKVWFAYEIKTPSKI